MEMRAVAARYISRLEKAIGEAVTGLQNLHKTGATTCTLSDRIFFRKMISEAAFVQRIGLVNKSGVQMCIEPEQRLTGKEILPPWQENAPRVGIGMLDQQFEGAHVAVVSWALEEGNRLIAEISPAAVAVDPGPEYLRSFRRVEVILGEHAVWLTAGENLGAGANSNDTPIIEQVSSGKYPMAATVSAPRSATNGLVRDLKIVAIIACASFALLFVAIGVWMSWRPENEAEDDFVAAIRNDEFIPYYQPVMDIQTGKLRGCEVLMRWRRPDGTIISPGQFMTFAETSGHIFEMTRRLMKITCQEVGDLYHENPDFKLSVNLFAGHFDDRRVIRDIKEIYGSSKIAYQQLVLEVTERLPLTDIGLARKIIAELQALDVRIALDDVGTGHGGLAYLQKLGVDVIKIDKMFIDSLGTDDSSATIVDTMVELADNLSMGIIAEGVEKEEQIERLRELGVSAAQGYFFSPPLPAKLFIELARALNASVKESEETSETSLLAG